MNQLSLIDGSKEAATMTSLEISYLVGSRHDNVKRTIDTLAAKGVIEFPQTEEIPTSTKPTTAYVFSGTKGRRDSIVVVAQLCPEFTARIVDRWQELEQGKLTAYALPQSPVAEKLQVADAIATALRYSESSRLGIVTNAVRIAAPQHLDLLPAYAVDAPAGQTAGSSEVTHSLTHLLKQHGIEGSAASWNLRLNAAGMIDYSKRVSSSGAIKSFWSVTRKGEAFGKNVTSPSNPRETQPHWFDAKFLDLLKMIGQEK